MYHLVSTELETEMSEISSTFEIEQCIVFNKECVSNIHDVNSCKVCYDSLHFGHACVKYEHIRLFQTVNNVLKLFIYGDYIAKQIVMCDRAMCVMLEFKTHECVKDFLETVLAKINVYRDNYIKDNSHLQLNAYKKKVF